MLDLFLSLTAANMCECVSVFVTSVLCVYVRRNLTSFIIKHLKTINVTVFLQGQTATIIKLCHLSECLMLENSFSNESHLLHCVCLFR